jgi:hypothetical protein
MKRDIFICHANEDKRDVVIPLWRALENEDIKCWVDEGEIKWGDSIIQKVNEGLTISLFVIVVLSEAFLGKNWPQRELNAVLNLEAGSGEVKVLPLLVGGELVREKILRKFPLLNDKRYVTWDGRPEPVVDAALNRLSKTRKSTTKSEKSEPTTGMEEKIPLPRLKKSFSQRDRDLFLKETFSVIKDYFQRALSQLEAQYPDVDTDFTEIHAQKFIAKIYLNGKVKNQCKIWMGGLAASDGIAYSENRYNIETDNSFNELISVVDDGIELKLGFLIGDMYHQQKMDRLNPLEAAEALWRRFTSPLERG